MPLHSFPLWAYADRDAAGRGAVIAPPYDVIDPPMREALVAADPCNIVNVELPQEDDAGRAAGFVQRWKRDGTLDVVGDGLVVLEQRFRGPDGLDRRRVTIGGAVDSAPYEARSILPHERTMSAPKERRRQLLSTVGMDISPVFLLYHDPDRSIETAVETIVERDPDLVSADVTTVGECRAWFVTDAGEVAALTALVGDRPLLIADGHHRYETALAHAQQSGTDRPRVLAFVGNGADPGMAVFATHRVISGASPELIDEFALGSGALETEPCNSVDEAMAALAEASVPGFVLYAGGRAVLYRATDPLDLELALPGSSAAMRSLDVVVAHAFVLDGGAVLTTTGAQVCFISNTVHACALVDDGSAQMALLLRPIDVPQVLACAEQGEVLPQKSTYFFPKLPTGVVLRDLGSS